MAFEPVDLVSPSGGKYTARSAVDLNDRFAEGYKRASAPVARSVPSPSPRWKREEPADVSE